MTPRRPNDDDTSVQHGWQSHFIASDEGLSLHCRVLGAGNRTCLLIHGYGDNGNIWTTFARAVGQSCRMVAPDLRGHGDSDWSRTGNYGLADYVRDASRVIAAICSDKLVIVGHSLGGRIGLHMAMLHPERIEGLVIVDFGPHPNPEARERVRSSVADDARTYGSIGAYAAQLMSRRPFLSSIAAHQIARDSLRPCAGGWELKCDPAVARSFGAGQGDDAVWAMLGDIRCPVLVVRGQLSAILTPQTAEKMTKVARNGRMQTVQRVGHGVVTENPEGLAAVVQNFLDDVTADPRGADRAEPRVGPRSDP